MAENDLVISKEDTVEGVKFIITGRIDTMNAASLEFKLEKALKDGKSKIILNMQQVEFLSSTGIRIILKAYMDAAKAGGKLQVEMPSERVRNVLGMVALDSMLIA